MNTLIERYVREVTRRLPEKDREEVGRELMANIADMLPDGAQEDEIRAALLQLGAPAQLAEKYRARPRYLISPAIFDEYLGALKLVLPIVAGVVFAAGLAVGCIEAASAGAAEIIGAMLSRGIEMALSGAFQALVWTTAAFAVADRVRGGRAGAWTPDELPELPAKDAREMPLASGIVGLALTAVFAAVALAACTGAFDLPLTLTGSDVRIASVFSADFLRACVPVIAVTAAFGALECVAIIAKRRWTPPVCAAAIMKNAANIGGAVFLATRPVIFSDELRALIAQARWGDFDLPRFAGEGGANVFAAVAALVVACSLIDCCTAVYKTVKGAAGRK